MPAYKTEAEASARLRELEAQYDLFQYTVEGYSAWRLLRFRAAALLQNLPFQEQLVPSLWLRLFKLLFQSVMCLPAFLFPHRSRYVVKTCSSALNEKEQGRWKDIYFDDLLKEVGDCFKIEVQNSQLFIERSKTALIPVTLTTSVIDFLSIILARIWRLSTISQVSDKISSHLRDDPDLNTFNRYIIANRLRRFYWSKKIYKWLLIRIRPSYLLFEGTSSFEICAAAKELGIKTVEFQHGIFSQNHPDTLTDLALPYKTTLIIPDKIFLYGDFWKRELELNRFYEQELCVVGSARIDRYRKIRSAYKAKNGNDAICNIVLTTQGLAVKQLICFMSQFIDLIEGRFNYKLYIKMHPIYDRDRSIYDSVFAFNPKVQVIGSSDETSTFDLLARADLHISISSACHYDALGLGVPTVILALPNHEIVLHLVYSDHARLAQTPRDLVAIVMNWQELQVKPEVSGYYFKHNSFINIKRELDALVV